MESNERSDKIHIEKEDTIYVDLSGRKVNITEDLTLVNEDITSLNIQSFKNALISTIANLNSAIEFLQHDIKAKNNTIEFLLKHINYLVETIPGHVDKSYSAVHINCNPHENPELAYNNRDSSQQNIINENNSLNTSRIVITDESPKITVNLNTPKWPEESYEYQLNQYKLKRQFDYINDKSINDIHSKSNPDIMNSNNNNRYLITIDKGDSLTDFGIIKSKRNASGDCNKVNSNYVDSINSSFDTSRSLSTHSPDISDVLNEEFSLNFNIDDIRL